MRKFLFIVLMGVVLACAWMHGYALAMEGFVTEKERAWAKKALAQEASIDGKQSGKSVAVLYFENKTDWKKLDLLQKGLALMLITDLSKLKDIQLRERIKMQALIEEMKLGTSGIFTPDTAPRIGKLLGASLLVGGEIEKGDKRPFEIQSVILSVRTEKSIGSPSVDGDLLEGIFQMEKDLLFEIIRILKIELTPDVKKMLKEPITKNLEALLYWFEAVDAGDGGNQEKARDLLKKAAEADPDFPSNLLAFDFRPDGGSSGTGYRPGKINLGGGSPGKSCSAYRNRLLRNTLKKRRW
jgi:TolB-like protein